MNMKKMQKSVMAAIVMLGLVAAPVAATVAAAQDAAPAAQQQGKDIENRGHKDNGSPGAGVLCISEEKAQNTADQRDQNGEERMLAGVAGQIPPGGSGQNQQRVDQHDANPADGQHD